MAVAPGSARTPGNRTRRTARLVCRSVFAAAGGLCCLPKDPAPERVRGECAAAEAPVPAVRLERPRPRTMESTEWRSLAEANRNEGDALVGTCGRYPDRG